MLVFIRSLFLIEIAFIYYLTYIRFLINTIIDTIAPIAIIIYCVATYKRETGAILRTKIDA